MPTCPLHIQHPRQTPIITRTEGSFSYVPTRGFVPGGEALASRKSSESERIIRAALLQNKIALNKKHSCRSFEANAETTEIVTASTLINL